MSGCIAIIPAKGQSSRIPGKNIRMFHGKPIITYSIETAKRANLFDKIIVSTDDVETANIAMEAGAFALHRLPELSAENVGTQEIALQAASAFVPDLVCCIYATAPLMDAEYIRRGFCAIRKDWTRFAFSVGDEPLRDAGQFYWSRWDSLYQRHDLIGDQTALIRIPPNRVCDINDESDWSRAEAMYAALHA